MMSHSKARPDRVPFQSTERPGEPETVSRFFIMRSHTPNPKDSSVSKLPRVI